MRRHRALRRRRKSARRRSALPVAFRQSPSRRARRDLRRRRVPDGRRSPPERRSATSAPTATPPAASSARSANRITPPCGAEPAGDCWLFAVPVDSLGRGERIGIDFLFGNDASAPKYYRLEYFERGRWLPAAQLRRAAEDPDIRYTHRLFASGKGNSYKVFGTIRLRDALVRDTLRIRWVQAADLRADDGRPIPSDSIGASGFCNAHGLGACIRRLGARPLSRPRSVLFIGNSYTYYNLVPGIVRELASFEGRDLRVEMFTIGGCTMERHLEQADCRDLIERGGYDFVVLQDQSLHPALIGTPDDQGIAGHMEAIVAHIRTHNPKVSPYIEMTWGRRDGYTERKFDYDFLRSYASMQAAHPRQHPRRSRGRRGGLHTGRRRMEPRAHRTARHRALRRRRFAPLLRRLLPGGGRDLHDADRSALRRDALRRPARSRHGGLPAPRGGADRTGRRITKRQRGSGTFRNPAAVSRTPQRKSISS